MHKAERAARRDALTDETQKEKMNAWTVGLAGGLLEGAPLRLAAEMARVVDDGPNLHVLPIVTRGATENLNSLLYLRGVDTGDHQFRRARRIQDPGPGDPAPHHLPAQSLPVGAAYLRPARDPEPAGSRRQESEFQHPGHGRRLFGAADLQPPRHQCQKRPSFRIRSRWSRCAKARWRPSSSSHRSRSTPSCAGAGSPASSSFR